jgi:hypothetical protein
VFSPYIALDRRLTFRTSSILCFSQSSNERWLESSLSKASLFELGFEVNDLQLIPVCHGE